MVQGITMPTRLDKKLLTKLAEKLGKSEQYTREQISKKASQNRVSSEAYFVHWLNIVGIGSANFRRGLDQHIKSEILSLHPSEPTVKTSAVKSSSVVKKHKKENSLGITASPPILSEKNIKDAEDNGRLYPALFIFENSLRTFIEKVLAKKYGPDWWATQVNNEVKKNVEIRIRKERLNRWHGMRGEGEIFYADFLDLSKILHKNTEVFTPFFRDYPGELRWLTQKLEETSHSRNNIAHSAPLKKKDRERLMIYFDDWYSLISDLNDKL